MLSRERKIGTLFILATLLILSSVGCDKLEKLGAKIGVKVSYKKKALEPQGTVIAKVGDLSITLEQLEQEVKNYNDLVQDSASKITTREQKIVYLNEELIRRYLLYLEAAAKKLDEKPKTQELLRSMEINVLANQFLQDEVGGLTVTSSEVEDFYNLYKEQYRQEEERKIREILVNTEDEAKEAMIELLKGTDFASLATQRSRAESASRGGDLGFIKRGQMGADFSRFEEVVFSRSLDAGQTSNIFKDKNGYYVIKVEEIRGGQAKSLSEVWDEIKRSVLFLKQQQKLQEIINGLTKNTKVVVYEDKIK
ncbi:MAG: peptidyl-prolyl cis-trans isomerase [Candidatus Omnitrophica bacterium]|nr:peptidyl-prolyl cis-trans isomerase [Candidatus Omnitrophota bacterium]